MSGRRMRPISLLNPTQSITETSRWLWTNRKTIRIWIKQGKISSTVVDGVIHIPTYEIQRVAQQKGQSLGNPAPEGYIAH